MQTPRPRSGRGERRSTARCALGGAKQRAVLAMLGLDANRTVSRGPSDRGPVGRGRRRRARRRWCRTTSGSCASVLARRRRRGDRHARARATSCASTPTRRRAALRAAACRGGRAPQRPSGRRRARGARAVARAAAGRRRRRAVRAPPRSAGSRSCALTALEQAIDADLAAGRHREVVGELEALRRPSTRCASACTAQRMLALYRCGRQAEALEAYRAGAAALVEEIGVEPGPELRAAARRDPAPGPAARARAARRPSCRRLSSTRRDAARGPRGRELRAAARALATTRTHGAGALVALVGAARHRQDPAGGRAGGRGAPRRRRRCSTRPAPARPAAGARRDRPRARVRARPDAARGRRRRPCGGRGARGARASWRRRLDALPRSWSSPRRRTDGGAGGARADAAIALGPLDADGRARRSRASTRRRGDADRRSRSTDLLDESGGVPRRVHERRAPSGRGAQAARRVGAVAGPHGRRARRAARALEDELDRRASSSCRRHASALRAPVGAGRRGRVVCPYKGLACLRRRGRRVLLRARAARRRAGGAARRRAAARRSSDPRAAASRRCVRAGLLPALADGVLPGSDGWTQVLIRPGEHPLRELRDADGRTGRGSARC